MKSGYLIISQFHCANFNIEPEHSQWKGFWLWFSPIFHEIHLPSKELGGRNERERKDRMNAVLIVESQA